MRSPVTAFIGLGANLGDPRTTISQALKGLAQLPETLLVTHSSLYRTAPLDSSGPDYVNAVAEISTTLTAPALLQALQNMERACGRQRPYRNAPRTLDLDILTFGDASIDSPSLHIPHPRMHERAFVLTPLAEIAEHKVFSEHISALRGQAIERL